MDVFRPPKQTLLILRLLWGGSILVQTAIAAVVMAVLANDSSPPGGTGARQVVFIAAAAFLVLVPLGYFIRNQIYKANWRGNAITPSGYFHGNVALLGLMEAASIVAIIIAWMQGQPLPAMYITGSAILVQLINFPTGRPMQPQPPVLDERERR